MVVAAMIASPIQNKTKNPLKSRYSLFGSKCETREAYSIVGKIRRLRSALMCLRAEEIDCTEGGAFSGIGVEVPLTQSIFGLRNSKYFGNKFTYWCHS